jgi:hypothetical protein
MMAERSVNIEVGPRQTRQLLSLVGENEVPSSSPLVPLSSVVRACDYIMLK